MRKLTALEMRTVQGGDLTSLIDGYCVGTGIVAVFATFNPVSLAFCGGWALGRAI